MTGTDPVAALEQLAVMRERGLVTAEEYDAKRAEILARLNQQAPPGPPAAPPIAPPFRAAPPPPAKKEGSAAGGAILLILIIAGAWWFFGRDSGGGGAPIVQDPVWTPPAGFTRYDAGTGYRWIEPAAGDCIGDKCWAMEVVTRAGCPTSLYVELSLVDSSGTAVGYTNDVAGAVSAGQKARLTFDSFEASARTARLTQLNCY